MPSLSCRGRAALPLIALLVGCAQAPRRYPNAGAAPNARPVTETAGQPSAPAVDHSQHQMASHDAPGHGAAGHDAVGHQMGAGPITIPSGARYTEADVRFMQGMIAHHGQAVHMSRLALSHGAGPRLVRFAQKIDQGQLAEIQLMQDWLRANQQAAPAPDSWRSMTMPGMLSADELAQLEAARGAAFDRLFLTFMIRHHEGAIAMVHDLFASPRAGQDVDVNVFANDVVAVQTAEIALMRQMLDAR